MLLVFTNLLFLMQINAQSLFPVDPDTVTQGDHVQITITGSGTHFTDITNINAVHFRQSNLRIFPDSLDIVNDSLIYGYYSINYTVTGLWDLRVTTATDGQMNKTGALTVLVSPNKPKLTAIDPDTAMQGDQLYITVYGTNSQFTGSTSLQARILGGTTMRIADSVIVINDTVLLTYFTLPFTIAARKYNFIVNNTVAGNLALDSSFTILVNPAAPKLLYIEPDSAYQGDIVSIKIYGQNTSFATGTNLTVTLFGGTGLTLQPDSGEIINDTFLLMHFSIKLTTQIGFYAIRVNNSIDGLLSITDAFLVIANPDPPRLIGITPDSVYQGSSVMFEIYAHKTYFTMGNKPNVILVLQAMQLAADSAEVINDSLMHAWYSFSPTVFAGLYNIRLANGYDGTLTLNGAVRILISPSSPQISHISPIKAYQGDSVTMQIYGKNTSFDDWYGGPYPNVRLIRGISTINAYNVVKNSDSLLTADFAISPTAITGLYNLVVPSSVHGDLALPQSFEVLIPPTAPQIVYISPARAALEDSLQVTVVCRNTELTLATNLSLTIQRGAGQNIIASNLTVINDSVLTAIVKVPPTFNPGLCNVRLSGTADGTLNLSGGFEVTPHPVIVKINMVTPDSAYTDQSLFVVIMCSGTKLSKAAVLEIEFISPSDSLLIPDSVQVINDTTLMMHLYIPEYAEEGLYDVNIFASNDGQMLLENAFLVYHNTSVKEINPSALRIYPNPFTDQLQIQSEQNIIGIEVYDVNGRNIKSITGIDQNLISLTMTDEPGGIYILRIFYKRHSEVFRLMKE